MFSLISDVFPINANETVQSGEEPKQTNLLFVSNGLSCKQSLIFQLIQSLILESNEDIHYILCDKKSATMPKPVDQMQAIGLKNASLLTFLKVYYLSTYESLLNHLLGVQSRREDMCPMAIIIDNVGHYADEMAASQPIDTTNDRPPQKKSRNTRKDFKQVLAELSALLISTGNCCRKKLKRNTIIVMGCDLDYNPGNKRIAIKSIADRFYDYLWTIRTTAADDETSNYEMDCHSSGDDCQLRLDLTQEYNSITLESVAKKNVNN